MPQIPAGQHELKVQLHNNDHTPIQPDITNAITVSFTAGQAGAASQPAAAQAPAQSGQQQASAGASRFFCDIALPGIRT